MKVLRSGLVKGVSFLDDAENKKCIPCVKVKSCMKQTFRKKTRRATKKLELVHTDLCGPVKPTAIDGSKYIMLLIDDYTRKTFCNLLKR